MFGEVFLMGVGILDGIGGEGHCLLITLVMAVALEEGDRGLASERV